MVFMRVTTAQGNVVPLTSSAVDLPPGFHVPSGTASLTNTVTYDEQGFPFYYDLTSIMREAPSQASDSALEDFLANLGQSVFLPVGARTSIEVMSADDTPVPHRYAHSDPVALDTGSEHDGEEGFRVHFAPLPELSVVVGQGCRGSGVVERRDTGTDPSRHIAGQSIGGALCRLGRERHEHGIGLAGERKHHH